MIQKFSNDSLNVQSGQVLKRFNSPSALRRKGSKSPSGVKQKKRRINFRYRENDKFSEEISGDHPDFKKATPENKTKTIKKLVEDLRDVKIESKCLILKALSHVLEGTYLQDKDKHTIIENAMIMVDMGAYRDICTIISTNLGSIHEWYLEHSKMTKLKGKHDLPDKDNNRSIKDSLKIKPELSSQCEELHFSCNVLCVLLLCMTVSISKTQRDQLNTFFLKSQKLSKSFLETLLDSLCNYTEFSICEYPIKRICLILKYLLLIILGGYQKADEVHDKFRTKLGLPERQHRLRPNQRSKKMSISPLKTQKMRLENYREYFGNVIQNHFGINPKEISDMDDETLINFHSDLFPPALQESLRIAKNSIYIPMSAIHIAHEENKNDFPLTLGNKILPNHKWAQKIYKIIAPKLRYIMLSVLKLFLAAVPSKEGNRDLPIFSELNIYDNTCYVPSSELSVDGLTSMKISIDQSRQREIILKTLSCVILLLLKHLKANHVYQFETVTYHLASMNFIPLCCKFFNMNIMDMVFNKCSFGSYDFPWKIVRNSPQPDSLTADISSKDFEESTLENAEKRKNRKYNWRILATVTNLLRCLQKVTKWHDTRVKLIKSQVPLLGKQWCKNNMKVISNIYLQNQMHLHDDWVNVSNKAILNKDLRITIEKAFKNEDEFEIKRRIDLYNKKYLEKRDLSDFNSKRDIWRIPLDKVYKANNDILEYKIHDKEFDKFINELGPIEIQDWVQKNVYQNPIDWDKRKEEVLSDLTLFGLEINKNK